MRCQWDRAPFRRRIILTAVLTVSAPFVPWDTCYAYLAPLRATVGQEVGRAQEHGLDGIIVYVDQAARRPALYAAGWRDRKGQLPADPEALFKIASISKLYMATAAAKLVHAGRLSLDNTLASQLPGLTGRIENAERITLRMLLRHRSGIPDFIDDKRFDWSKAVDSGAQLKLVLDKPADFAPDLKHRYSNTNYLLLGAILDKILGYSHQEYIRASIVTPLRLANTHGQMADVDPNRVASGYGVGYPEDLKSLDYVIAGGSMIATAQDVGIFLRALVGGTLLNHEEQAIYSSIYVYEHTGLLPGYQSIARYHKDIDAVVVQFVNTSGGNAWGKSEAAYSRIIRVLRREAETHSGHSLTGSAE